MSRRILSVLMSLVMLVGVFSACSLSAQAAPAIVPSVPQITPSLPTTDQQPPSDETQTPPTENTDSEPTYEIPVWVDAAAYAQRLGISGETFVLLWTRICEGLFSGAEEIMLRDLDITYDLDTTWPAFVDMFWSILDHYSELFYVDTFQPYTQEDKFYSIQPICHYSWETYRQMKIYIDVAVGNLLYGIEGNDVLTDLEKALLVHDRLIVFCEYDYANYLADTLDLEDYNMYGPLVQRNGVCQGYAEAYQYMMQRLGFDCRLCFSEELDHTWNILTLDGVEYHVDTTWDDPVWDTTGKVLHTNFLRSTEGIVATGHVAGDYDTAPTDTRYDDWFWQASETEFQLFQGEIYYLYTPDATIRRWDETHTAIYTINAQWLTAQGGDWAWCYSSLSSDANHLYFSTAKEIYRLDILTGEVVLAYQPPLEAGVNIFGFKLSDHMFYCDVYNTPCFDETTKNYQIRVYYMDFPTLTEVQVYQPPEKTVYLVGEELDTYGLLLRAWYSNGAANVVWDELVVQGFDSSKAGTSTVTVTYGDKTATFECQVQQRTGDINGDTNINAMDATRILLSTVGKVTLKVEQVQAADVNGDGKINAMDATLILLHTVGKKQIA